MSRPPIIETPFDSVDYVARAELPAAESPDRVQPVALFLAGGPLSGKSFVLERLIANGDPLIPADPVEILPSAIRSRLPEFGESLERWDPQTAHHVYEETLHIASLIVTEAVRRRRNLILDGIGAGKPGAFAAQLERIAAAGYDVRVLLVDAPIDVALRRNEERTERTGFRIDPKEIRRLHNLVSKRFEEGE